MKLLRYGPSGREKPGMLDSAGNIRDLTSVIFQIDDRTLAPKELAKLRKLKPESLPLVKGKPRLGVPYAGISKFVAVAPQYVACVIVSNDEEKVGLWSSLCVCQRRCRHRLYCLTASQHYSLLMLDSVPGFKVAWIHDTLLFQLPCPKQL